MKIIKLLIVFVSVLLPIFSYASGGTFADTGHRGFEQKLADVMVWIVILIVPDTFFILSSLYSAILVGVNPAMVSCPTQCLAIAFKR